MKGKYINLINQKDGFTVVELMIATAVFSIVLLLSLAGFLQIGQMFYKGVNITQTSNVLNQTATSLKNDILFDTGTEAVTIFETPRITTPDGQITRYYFCAGSNRYSFIKGKQLDRAAGEAEINGPNGSDLWYQFALLKDRLTTSGCPNPFSTTSSAPIDPDNVTELLGDKMRLSQLEIPRLPSPNDKLYTVFIKVAYGDNEVLTDSDLPSASCKQTQVYSKYCFVSEIKTTARKGLDP